jgi:hypothetical protein
MPGRARLRRAVTVWFAAQTHPANLAVVRITVFWILLDRLLSGGFRRYARLPEDLRILPPGIEPVLHVLPYDEQSVGIAAAAASVFALLALVGLFTRTSAALATLIGSYVLVAPYLFGKVDHTLHHVIWFGALLAASPSGDALSIDAWLARRRGRPAPGPARAYALPIRLMWLLIGVAYFFPGLYKLLAGPRWVLSENLQLLLWESFRHHHALPALRVDLHPLLVQGAALATILFELSFVFLVLSRRTRPFAVAAGLFFHASTAYFMHILFLELMHCYVVFVDWVALARRLRAGAFRAESVSAAPRWQASAAVGAALLAANVACGVFQIDSWPFSVYPRFATVRVHPISIDVEAMLESEGASQRLKLPLRGSMLERIAKLPEGEERDRRFRALTQWVLAGRDPLAAGETVRIYAVSWSTRPEDWKKPPLRRDLLFDYHAGRDDEPCPES